MNEQKKALSLMDIGYLIGMSPATVRMMAENGEIKAEKVGNRWQVPLSDTWKSHPKYQQLTTLHQQRIEKKEIILEAMKQIPMLHE